MKKGDHSPWHVHVYKDGKFILKYDLENSCAMKTGTSKSDIDKAVKYISELKRKGKL